MNRVRGAEVVPSPSEVRYVNAAYVGRLRGEPVPEGLLDDQQHNLLEAAIGDLNGEHMTFPGEKFLTSQLESGSLPALQLSAAYIEGRGRNMMQRLGRGALAFSLRPAPGLEDVANQSWYGLLNVANRITMNTFGRSQQRFDKGVATLLWACLLERVAVLDAGQEAIEVVADRFVSSYTKHLANHPVGSVAEPVRRLYEDWHKKGTITAARGLVAALRPPERPQLVPAPEMRTSKPHPSYVATLRYRKVFELSEAALDRELGEAQKHHDHNRLADAWLAVRERCSLSFVEPGIEVLHKRWESTVPALLNSYIKKHADLRTNGLSMGLTRYVADVLRPDFSGPIVRGPALRLAEDAFAFYKASAREYNEKPLFMRVVVEAYIYDRFRLAGLYKGGMKYEIERIRANRLLEVAGFLRPEMARALPRPVAQCIADAQRLAGDE